MLGTALIYLHTSSIKIEIHEFGICHPLPEQSRTSSFSTSKKDTIFHPKIILYLFH